MKITEKKLSKVSRKIDFTGFKIKDELNSQIWDTNKKMVPEVRKTLLKIANDYFEKMDIPNLDIDDIHMTGSLANYNWSKYSDIDLHILIDFNDVPMKRDLVQDFLKTKSDLWNSQHDIKIYDYDIELYVQDVNEKHFSTGVYSVLQNEWVIVPSKETIDIDNDDIKLKSNRIMDKIEALNRDLKDKGDYDDIILRADTIRGKIKKMRQSGLERDGEFSNENIVFKILRRNGMLDRLNDIKIIAYDKSLTI